MPKMKLPFAMLVMFVLGMYTSAWTAERHPQIRAAQALLIKAQEHLMNAAGDFQGHKLKAMEHVKAAVLELNAAVESDRN
jgi:hypothetical protein